MNIVLFILIGAIAGWISGRLMKGEGFGLIGNVIVGIVGAVLGGWLFDQLEITTSGIIGALSSSVVGAVLFLFVVGLLKRNNQ